MTLRRRAPFIRCSFPNARRSARSRLRAVVSVALTTLPLGLAAQSAPVATAPTLPLKEEVITLTPFEVAAGKDYGYQAASVVAGTALATPLKESSAVVGVLTKEFIEDIGARTMEEAAAWAPNTYFLDGAEGEQIGESPTSLGYSPNAVIRGTNGQGGALGRDYFVSNVPMDTATLERVEQPRGPNASLFGSAALGGLVNGSSKKALLQRRTRRLDLRADGNGSLRAALDVNAGYDRVALRLNGMNERVRGWRDGDEERNRLAMLSATWRVARTTTIRAEALWDHRAGSFPPAVYVENVSKWDGATIYTGPRTANPAAATGATGISNANDYWLFDSTNGSRAPLNWRGYGTTTGFGLALYPDRELTRTLRPEVPSVATIPSREFAYNPVGTPMSRKDSQLYGATVEHLFFGRLAAQFACNYTHTRVRRWQFNFNALNRDINQVRPDGTPNPRFGELYTDQNGRRDENHNFTRNARLLLSYPLKWRFMEQRLVGMAGLRSEASNLDRYQLARSNGPNRLINNQTNQVRVRRYVSDGDSDLPFPTGSFSGVDVGLYPWNVNYTRTQTEFWQAALAGRYWDGRVTTTVGWRHDYVGFKRSETVGTATFENGVAYGWGAKSRFRPDSLTLGAVYFPVPGIGLFVNAAEGYNLQGVRTDLYGNPWPTPQYTGLDLGLKLELLGGRLSGTLSRYISKREGVDPQAASPQNNFGQLWINAVAGYTSLATKAAAAGDAALAAKYTADATRAQAREDEIVGTAYDSRTLEANGWELDLTANLTRSWRATFNLARPETEQAQSSPIAKAYYAAHRAEWEAMLNDSANFNLTSTQNQLKAIEDALRVQADGSKISGTPDYTANFFTNYRLLSGRLKGMRFGGGVQFQGARIIGVPLVFVATSATAGSFATPDPLATIKSQATRVYTAMAGYDFRLRGRAVRLQLNIANLLDHHEPIFTNLATYTVPVTPSAAAPIRGYQVLNRFRYIPPRNFTLTVSADL